MPAVNPRPSWLYAVVAVLSWPVIRVVFRLQVRGLEHVPRHGGYVLSANHWSNIDPWPLGIPLFPGRFLRFMAKAELFWFPLGAVIRAGGGFRVRRGERDDTAIETAVALCRDGHVVVMFPEGTRRTKGLRKRFEARWHTGAARIALEAGVPLVPAAVAGTDRISRLVRMRVAYGTPIAVDDLRALDPAAAAGTATERLRDAILRLEASLT